ncbi:MAG: FumA C-terminus/TtdB family hydratase beta subunit [Bacteroidales bacterium]|jgi:fumarate hydratase class I|nr:FumA C-terminus/TtdB family hydratase beta subunit [Bacteroidales bacterium]
MADFKYKKMFETRNDSTQYRLISKDYVSTIEVQGKKILQVDPKGLEILAEEAINDVSFYLRASHLEGLKKILQDPETSDNDKFVADTMLRNQVIAAEGELPTCQDTGTAIVIAKKGEQVWTGVDDAEYLSKGIYSSYQEKNLRYSQVVPTSMFEEKNSGSNMPAQIDIMASQGNNYELVFLTKGGGSANKTFLYQMTKSLLNEESFTAFVKEKLKDLGTSACPPYHIAFVIGGQVDTNLKTVKLASAKYYDSLPTEGNEYGQAYRDVEWEAKIQKLAEEFGVGAQFGGKAFAHDIRVIRLPRHAASCAVGLGVSCSADRNIKAKITEEGIFLEQLEKHPENYLPEAKLTLEPAVDIDLDQPMEEVLKILTKYPIKTRLNLSGTLIVARDIAHAQIKKMLDDGKAMPEYMKNHPVYYAGPAKTPKGMASGSFGPTTASRMDPYVDLFQSLGGSMIMLAKGNRSPQVREACKKHGGFYLGSIGGPAAILAKQNIKSSEVIDFEDLGMESVRKIRVENFPAFIICDDKGNDFFLEF